MAAFRNPKAEAWVKGRKELFKELEHKIVPQDRIIWMHCASAGELEQGKPVIEALKVQYPEHKILVSFFSPSGFSSGKKYPGIDILCYLPADTGANAKRFLDILKPELVIFVKYEYWYHHLKEVSDRKIPSLLISSIFRTDQFFSPGMEAGSRRSSITSAIFSCRTVIPLNSSVQMKSCTQAWLETPVSTG